MIVLLLLLILFAIISPKRAALLIVGLLYLASIIIGLIALITFLSLIFGGA